MLILWTLTPPCRMGFPRKFPSIFLGIPSPFSFSPFSFRYFVQIMVNLFIWMLSDIMSFCLFACFVLENEASKSQSFHAFLTGAAEKPCGSVVQCNCPSPSSGNYWPWWLPPGLQVEADGHYFLSTIHLLSLGSPCKKWLERFVGRV